MANMGYAPGGALAGMSAGSGDSQDTTGYWPLSKLKRCYLDYLGTKREEIDEQQEARRYYHGAQWTSEQIEILKKRKQPVVTKNRVARKVDAIVGLIERLRQDPKGYARTPAHEAGAELATAVLRYVLDEQDWAAKSPEVARDGAIDGIGGIEIEVTQGDRGDNDIGFEIVEPDSFFYDPRSYRMDFSDARHMGVGKWIDIDTAKEMFPDQAEALDASAESGSDLTSNPDREDKWFAADGMVKRVRLVDHWYRHKGEWCWCIYTGAVKLMEGASHLVDQKGRSTCKFVMFSANVDHDGDRYGFIRNMKSAQDEINMRTSKGLHIANSRRLIMTEGAVQDVELTRREWARPDGVVVVNGTVGETIRPEDQTGDLAGQLKFLEEAKAEIENYGFNPALIGTGVKDMSGRAIQLQQQAGVAELGPYILAFRSWKVRVYRAIWNAVARHWQAERWIRVTDDEQVAQFVKVNGLGIDPATGQPAILNALGALDVDVILDEGPDTITMTADAYDTLSVMAARGAQVPPALLIELAPIASSIKKKYLAMLQPANPAQQQAQAQVQAQAHGIAMRKAAADIAETEARAEQARAQAAKTISDVASGGGATPEGGVAMS